MSIEISTVCISLFKELKNTGYRYIIEHCVLNICFTQRFRFKISNCGNILAKLLYITQLEQNNCLFWERPRTT